MAAKRMKVADRQFFRYVGINERGYAEKFSLGYDLEEAERRLRLIKTLWAELNSRIEKPWTTAYLNKAKAIAKGKSTTFPPKSHSEAPEWYLERPTLVVNRASNGAFEPANEADYHQGIVEARETLDKAQNALSNGKGKIRTDQTL